MKYLLIFPLFALAGGLVWYLVFSPFGLLSPRKILSPTTETQELFQITEPGSGDVVTLANLKIKGTGQLNSYLAVAGFNDSQVLKISDSGSFETNLNLGQGFNLIKLVNFAKDGKFLEKELEIFYLSEKFEELATSANKLPKDDATKAAIKRLVQLRQKQNLKIVSGAVKGILDKSVKDEPASGGNLAVESETGTKTVVVASETQIGTYPDFAKILDFGAVQAQDFIVAVGNFSQQGILSAKMVFVNADKVPSFNKSAFFGIVTKQEDESFELANILDGRKDTILVQNSQVYGESDQKNDVKNITVGNKVLAVGKLEKEKFAAEKIMVIEGNFLQELEKFATPPPPTQSSTESAR